MRRFLAWAIVLAIASAGLFVVGVWQHQQSQNQSHATENSEQIRELARDAAQITALTRKLCTNQNETRWETRRFIGELTTATPYPKGSLPSQHVLIARGNALKRRVRAEAEASFKPTRCPGGPR